MKAERKMTMNESKIRPGFTSSGPTEAYISSDKILQLGKELVAQLGLEPSVDTLGRWMAHYIAELMTAIEGASGEKRAEAEKRCFDAILALWQHRNEYPRNKRPFSDLESVMRAVESLDPDDDTPRYFRTAYPDEEEGKATDAETKKWIKIAEGLDYTAKVLIGDCLREAARKAADKGKRWVALAEAAGAERGVPEIIIRFVAEDSVSGEEPDPNEDARKQISGRLERLEAFAQLVAHLKRDYEEKLAALPATAKVEKE
jgi:hypothetical protein